ncbi:MAG: hypothetical protein A2W02_02265 [Alphaproteobacteria bacterium RBG_16_64_48]|nr:MAG: hypothetical protein A2W02_02265 [Alphaproteobacteria bacterium RBG_16_64_48]
MAFGNRLFELDACITKILGRDVTEDVRGHHAQRWPIADQLTERTGAVTKDDPILSLLYYEEAALNATFEVHHYVSNLRGREPIDLQCVAIFIVEFLANGVAYNADVTGRLINSERVLKRACKFP